MKYIKYWLFQQTATKMMVVEVCNTVKGKAESEKGNTSNEKDRECRETVGQRWGVWKRILSSAQTMINENATAHNGNWLLLFSPLPPAPPHMVLMLFVFQ
jgi:hypothetical protein